MCVCTLSAIDDHFGRRCRAGAGGQFGSLLRGYCLQCSPTQEELEEHFKLVWWGEDAQFLGSGRSLSFAFVSQARSTRISGVSASLIPPYYSGHIHARDHWPLQVCIGHFWQKRPGHSLTVCYSLVCKCVLVKSRATTDLQDVEFQTFQPGGQVPLDLLFCLIHELAE